MPAAAIRKDLDHEGDRDAGAPRLGIVPTGAKLYDTEGAAKYLKCSPGHIRKLVSTKKLKSVGRGKSLAFTKATLDGYKRSKRKVGRPIGSGEIRRSEDERRWWREYMRKRRLRSKLAKKAGAAADGTGGGAEQSTGGRAAPKKSGRKVGTRKVSRKGRAGAKAAGPKMGVK
jgi:excisionase family DNA binding protein